MKLEIISGTFSILRFAAQFQLPAWLDNSNFHSITRSSDETSIICESRCVPPGTKCESDWIAFRAIGPLDFALTDVLSSLINPLSQAGISTLVISTFDTEYILIKANKLDLAKLHLTQAGHRLIGSYK